MRYGILVDLAQRLLAGEPIDLAMGYVNVIWQAEANQMALCALDHAASPPLVVNVAGAEEVSVRTATESLARALGRPATFTGVESPDALAQQRGAGVVAAGGASGGCHAPGRLDRRLDRARRTDVWQADAV